MLKRTLLGLVVAAVCSTTGLAQTIVFDNTDGLAIDASSPNDLSAFIGGETVDDFSFAATTVLTGIQFRGAYVPDAIAGGDGVVPSEADNFEIRIYEGSPLGQTRDTAIATFAAGGANRTAGETLAIGVGGADLDTFNFEADINFTADAGTTYFVSVFNNTAADPDNFNQLVVSTGGNALSVLNGAPGQENTNTFSAQGFVSDFQLVSAVPEPSSAILLALGLAGFAARRRR